MGFQRAIVAGPFHSRPNGWSIEMALQVEVHNRPLGIRLHREHRGGGQPKDLGAVVMMSAVEIDPHTMTYLDEDKTLIKGYRVAGKEVVVMHQTLAVQEAFCMQCGVSDLTGVCMHCGVSDLTGVCMSSCACMCAYICVCVRACVGAWVRG